MATTFFTLGEPISSIFRDNSYFRILGLRTQRPYLGVFNDPIETFDLSAKSVPFIFLRKTLDIMVVASGKAVYGEF